MADLSKEYSEKFDNIRKTLITASFYKYGPARQNFSPSPLDGQPRVDAIGCIEKCLKKFKETGNTEYLADIANYAMFRYMYPLKGEQFRYTDSGESAGIVGMSWNELQKYKEENNF